MVVPVYTATRYVRVPATSHPWQDWWLSCFIILVILVGVQWWCLLSCQIQCPHQVLICMQAPVLWKALFLLSLSVLIAPWTGATHQVAFCSPRSSLSCLDVRSVSWTCSVCNPLCSDVQVPCLLLLGCGCGRVAFWLCQGACGRLYVPSSCKWFPRAYVTFPFSFIWKAGIPSGWEWKVECDVLWHPPFS